MYSLSVILKHYSIKLPFKVKVNFSLCLTKYHAMKSYPLLIKQNAVSRESRGIAPYIHNLGTRWRWVISFTPRPFCPSG